MRWLGIQYAEIRNLSNSGCRDLGLGKGKNSLELLGKKKKYTKSELVDLWGKPDRVTAVNDCEVLIYNNGYHWSGIMTYLIVVPIPLGVPSGRAENRVYFKNDLSVALVSEHTSDKTTFGYMCGELECGFLAGKVYPFTGLPIRDKSTVEVAECK